MARVVSDTARPDESRRKSSSPQTLTVWAGLTGVDNRVSSTLSLHGHLSAYGQWIKDQCNGQD